MEWNIPSENDFPHELLDIVTKRYREYVNNLPNPNEPQESDTMDLLSTTLFHTITLGQGYSQLFPEKRQDIDALIVSSYNTYISLCNVHNDERTRNKIQTRYLLYLYTKDPVEALTYWQQHRGISDLATKQFIFACIDNGDIVTGKMLRTQLTSPTLIFSTFSKLLHAYETMGSRRGVQLLKQEITDWYTNTHTQWKEGKYRSEYMQILQDVMLCETLLTLDDPERECNTFLEGLTTNTDLLWYQEQMVRRLLKEPKPDPKRIRRASSRLLHDLHRYTNYTIYSHDAQDDTLDMGSLSLVGRLQATDTDIPPVAENIRIKMNVINGILRHPSLHSMLEQYLYPSRDIPHPSLQSLLERKEDYPNRDYWTTLFECLLILRGKSETEEAYSRACAVHPDYSDLVTSAYAAALVPEIGEKALTYVSAIEDEYSKTKAYLYLLPIVYKHTRRYASIEHYVTDRIVYETCVQIFDLLPEDTPWSMDEETEQEFDPHVPYLLLEIFVRALSLRDFRTAGDLLGHSAFPDWMVPVAIDALATLKTTGTLTGFDEEDL